MSKGMDNKISSVKESKSKEEFTRSPAEEIVDILSNEEEPPFFPGRNPLLFNNPDLKKLNPLRFGGVQPEKSLVSNSEDNSKLKPQPQSKKQINDGRAMRLRKIRDAIGMPRAALVGLTKISDVNLARVENNEVGMSEELASWICQRVNAQHNIFISVDWLLHGTGPEPSFRRSQSRTNIINSVMDVVCETGRFTSHLDDYVHVWSIIQQVFQHFFEENAIVVAVNDRRMEPDFAKGSTVGGRKIARSHWRKLRNEPVILQAMHGRAVIRLLSFNEQHEYFIISYIDRKYPPELIKDHEISWIAHVDFVSYNMRKLRGLPNKYFAIQGKQDWDNNPLD
jgi:transcriptional regulator with XRE-family HTH domain